MAIAHQCHYLFQETDNFVILTVSYHGCFVTRQVSRTLKPTHTMTHINLCSYASCLTFQNPVDLSETFQNFECSHYTICKQWQDSYREANPCEMHH